MTSPVDFGTSLASIGTAQDLDLGAWGLNANPEIQSASTIPHLTVHGTGDGNSDYYKFTVSGTGTKQVVIDVDHGFQSGDPKVWLSKLSIFNGAGDLVAHRVIPRR